MSLSKLNETHPRLTLWLALLLLVGLTGGVYLGVTRCGFITFDDPDYVTQSPYVKQGLGAESIKWAFTHFHSSNWHPLTWCSHMLDVELFGLKPAGHHLHNLLLHCLNTVLLFLFLFRCTGAMGRAFLVAALFGVHPLHVESVAWVSERKDVLSTFFGLLSLLAYARYARTTVLQPPASSLAPWRSPMYWLTFVLLACGLMSKPMLVTWPCVMLLMDIWPLRRFSPPSSIFHLPSSRHLFLEKLPFFALSAISCFITMRAQGTGRSVISLDWLPLEVRVGNALSAILDYLARTFVPTDLAVFYPFPAEVPWGKALLAATILIAAFVFALRRLKEQPMIFVGLAWFVGTLIPVIGLVQVGMQASADRYAYIPHIGLFLALIWGAFELAATRAAWRQVLTVGLAAAIGISGFLTVKQVRVWQNDTTLFGHAKDVTKRNYIALTIYGRQLAEQGKNEEALELYRQVLEIQPNYAGGHYVTAEVYRNIGRTNDALATYSRAIELDPFHAESLNSRGALLTTMGRVEEAKQDFRKAMEVLPSFDLPRLNLAIVLQQQGLLEEAHQAFEDYLRLDPNSVRGLTLLADVEFRMGRLEAATGRYQQVLLQEPGNFGAKFGLACALARVGKFQEAQQLLVPLAATNQPMPDVLFQLGVAQCALNQPHPAVTNLQRAVTLKPASALYRYHLAMALDQAGRRRDAIRTYDEVLQQDPDFAEALNNLAWILATAADPQLRDGARAVSLAERACELTKQKEILLIGTLAAAYAEAGRFQTAVETAQRAIQMAQTNNQPALAQRNTELLELYRAGKAFHELSPEISHP